MARNRSEEAEKAGKLDDDIAAEDAREIALSKLLTRLADIEDKDASNIGLIERAVLAVERVERLEDEIDTLHDRLEEFEHELGRHDEQLDALGDITQQKTTKEQKVAAIVRYADQKRDQNNDAIHVFPREIKGLLDVSQRYAYQLVEDIAAEHEWAHHHDGYTEPSAKDGGKRIRHKKALELDFAGNSGESVPLNKFNNGMAIEGGTA